MFLPSELCVHYTVCGNVKAWTFLYQAHSAVVQVFESSLILNLKQQISKRL